jgi:hypothetical protein
MPLKRMRDVEVKYGDKWLLVEGLHKVRKGQVFRLWDDIDTPVYDTNGKTEFLATSEPYWSESFESWMIDIDLTEYSDIVN